MSRDHIDFLQSQHLPWTPEPLGTTRPNVQAKLLGFDPQSGDLTAIIRYPAGWESGPERLSADEEVFILDGAVEIDGLELTRDCYAYWPRAMQRNSMRSRSGADVLTFFSGDGGKIRRLSGDADVMTGKPIRCIDIREGAWTADVEAMGLTGMASSARIRTLRVDETRGEITYISATIPYWRESEPERHPVAQEFFVLSGEVAGPTGLMRQGGYVWRPAEAVHGPYGSLTGAVMLFRSTGGKFATTLLAPVPFSFTPQHRPIIPDSMRFASPGTAVPAARY